MGKVVKDVHGCSWTEGEIAGLALAAGMTPEEVRRKLTGEDEEDTEDKNDG
jgi:hypothetical protein